jgi:hypothetical protein
VLRLRRPLVVLALHIGVLIAAFAAASPGAQAQTTLNDPRLLRPALDGDPNNPPRFRAGARATQNTGEGTLFEARPAFGAGSTGFDSSNMSRRKKAQKAKAAAKAKTQGQAAAQAPAAPMTQPLAARAAAQVPAAAQNEQQRGTLAADAAPVATGSTATPAVLARRRRAVDDKPFDPVGIAAGSFRIYPAIEFIGGYDSNPARSMTGSGSWFTSVAPELRAQSNWVRHELTANLRGNYTAYESASDLNRPNVDAKVNGRIDVFSTTRLDLEGRFLISTDNPGSPNLQAGLAKLPINTTLGASAGVVHRFNRFELGLKGSIDRTVYQPSTFVDGSTGSNDDRNFNQYGAVLRGGYELTPGARPFAELGVDRRVHDIPVDTFGLRRDSDGWYGKVGTTFEYSQKLIGEIAVGYLTRRYQDPTLQPLGGVTFDAGLTWLASGLTTVKLTAKTSVDESRVADVSGVFTREVALQVDHAFRRWLIGTGKLARAVDTYQGSGREDERYVASAAITYMLSRELQLKGEYRREWMQSNTADNGYRADVVLFGIRLQR